MSRRNGGSRGRYRLGDEDFWPLADSYCVHGAELPGHSCEDLTPKLGITASGVRKDFEVDLGKRYAQASAHWRLDVSLLRGIGSDEDAHERYLRLRDRHPHAVPDSEVLFFAALKAERSRNPQAAELLDRTRRHHPCEACGRVARGRKKAMKLWALERRLVKKDWR